MCVLANLGYERHLPCKIINPLQSSRRWGALDEDQCPDPCAYANQTRRALKAAAPDAERSIAACADVFVERMAALEAHDKVRST